MKLFECQNCGQPIYFENTVCERCGLRLGFLSDAMTLSALKPDGERWRPLAAPDRSLRLCLNAGHEACNWLLETDDGGDYCAACRFNRTIPDLAVPENLLRWRKIELAKHHLVYSLLKLHLPLKSRTEDPENGLAFDFLADATDGPGPATTVLTGHDNGLITLNVAEADDAERERRRTEMGEPYRTLLGHFRHEIGHYYWDRLVRDTPALESFRTLFGDEREDYGEALKRHYANGAPADWRERFVSSYATAHPWEDFAETWAHYLHIIDTLETARSFGIRIRPRIREGAELQAEVDFNPYQSGTMADVIDAWLPLTYAINSLNRSMGQPDLYPFILAPAVIEKLTWMHDLVHGR
ncbi:zinc-binding metallopeptidase family protein [Arenibaculum pallidiluteum]|uniref:zinc-binding metallopeptidase family protein n=1 Tax=Arenibaculum pallidiluteum TaxID=2812559 RepID=UPI001A968F8A|nr:putative zinc-binding peptidase [Arenibaculum pallidiluteum]